MWGHQQPQRDLGGVDLCLSRCHDTGRVDLVHANDSRDEFDSGADRHTNFGSGLIEGEHLAQVVRDAGAPVVCETPGGVAGQAGDIAWLRSRVG